MKSVIGWLFLAKIAFASFMGAVLSPQSVNVLTTSNGTLNHAWFAQTYSSFDGGRVVAVMVQHHDDGCTDPTCKTCHKPLGCFPPTTTMITYDYGQTWAPVSGDLAHQMNLTLGAHVFNETNSWLMPKLEADASNPKKLSGSGLVATYKSGTEFEFFKVPVSYLDEFPAAVNNIAMWCDPIMTSWGELVQVFQVDLNTSTGGHSGRMLYLMASSDFGQSWATRSLVANGSDPMFSKYSNGPCESSILELDSGELFVVFRVDSFATYFHTRSSDQGHSFAGPTPFQNSALASVRPRLQKTDNSVFFVGGRPGLEIYSADSNATESSWHVSSLADLHNPFFAGNSSFQYASNWANRSVLPFDLHESTCYTSLVPTGSCPSDKGSRFSIHYDRLAHGWDGPPGPYGDEDVVFHMSICIN